MKFFTKPPSKLQAGALYYTILISFIISAILSAILMISYLQNRYMDIQIMQDQVNRNVSSAIQLMLSDPSVTDFDIVKTISLFNEDNDSVTISKKRWGGLDIISAQASWKNYSSKKTALCGINIRQNDSTALYLADENIYLSVCGGTYLNGNCYLPKLGVRRATIEGKFYKNKEEVFGKIFPSDKDLPEAGKEICNFVKHYTGINTTENDSIILFSALTREQSTRSFLKKPLLIYDNEIIYLKRHELKGNLVVLSDKGIRVGSDARLEDIIIIAPRIYFEKGFRGRLQAFAADSLVIDDRCDLQLTSLVGLVNENINRAGIIIGENVTIAGGIVLFQETRPLKPSILSIGENSVVYGQVYCNGYVQIKGVVYGSLYCIRFYLQTPSAYYENHLLDAVINIRDIPDSFIGYRLFEKDYAMKMIDWLE